MRPLSGIAFAFVVLLSSSVTAQTGPSQAALPQTARQALIEMLFGEAPDHVEKHLPDVTRQTVEKLKRANSQDFPRIFSLLAGRRAGGAKLETFDHRPDICERDRVPLWTIRKNVHDS